ncbi:hypothetical protein HMPREF0072_1331 [Anaerococcus lactolyticus ATCC 51172]|uniref:Uncharacterized protein n=1 Tax=Anaerococcus lactolyticus ATCC 51172 TaxID=525254 RepID=C2BG61_9FIRM|nr:hypothetical protein HMPREF0072_1331 [Anaerococcus lactolyticus ATCC 51172]
MENLIDFRKQKKIAWITQIKHLLIDKLPDVFVNSSRKYNPTCIKLSLQYNVITIKRRLETSSTILQQPGHD